MENKIELWVNNNPYVRVELSSEDVTLTESIDGIAYTLNATITNTSQIQNLHISKNTPVELYGYHYSLGSYWLLFKGCVWECDLDKTRNVLNIVAKERTIFLEESEEEFIFNDGETLTNRVKKIADYMEIPTSYLPDTVTKLSKDRRCEKIYSMIQKDIKETASKGGGMYRVRIDEKLDIVEIGSNSPIYDISSVVDSCSIKKTNKGLCTKVKVFGKNESTQDEIDDKTGEVKKQGNIVASPVIAEFWSGSKQWVQKIVQDEKIKTVEEGKEKAHALFSDGEDMVICTTVEDINILRAGNKIALYGIVYIIVDIEHKFGGKGKMKLTLMLEDAVRIKFYRE